VASTGAYSVASSTVFMSVGLGGRTFDLVTCSLAPISASVLSRKYCGITPGVVIGGF
jgi:hypothetical protein